jgi:DNA-binding NarL/FixJ family response regulator
MEQGQDHSHSQPDPLWLQEQKRRLAEELRPWRLLICTSDLASGLLMVANLLDTPPGQPSQQLLGLCRRAADAPKLLPETATDVLVLCQEFLQDGPALPVLHQLLRRPSPPTVLLSLANPHRVVIRAALAAGVQGLISQENVGRGVVLQALASLGRGQAFLDARCQTVLTDASPASHELTAREVEILALVAEGCTNRTIAERLQIAEVTARDHVQRILSKLQVPDRTAAAVAGLRRGYLP